MVGGIVDLNDIEKLDVRPKGLIEQVLKDYKNNFERVGALYLDEID